MQVQVEDFGLVDPGILLKLQEEGFLFEAMFYAVDGNEWYTEDWYFTDGPDQGKYRCADEACKTALREALKPAAKPEEYTFEEIVKAYVSNKLWWRFPGSVITYNAGWSPAQDDLELQDLIGRLTTPSDKETPEWFIGDEPPCGCPSDQARSY